MPKQSDVEKVNAFLKNLAGDGRSHTHFVEMLTLLSNTGELREEFTDDGLHLNGRGMKEIATRLQKLGLNRTPENPAGPKMKFRSYPRQSLLQPSVR